MRAKNFVSFLSVQGFFFGIIFGIIQSDSAGSLLEYVVWMTLFFYLFAHVCVGLYFHTLGIKVHTFPRHTLETKLDEYVRDINRREQFIDAYNEHRDELLSDARSSA